VSDARRNVKLYSTIKDRKSPIKGSRPSVPHGTNFINLEPVAHYAWFSLNFFAEAQKFMLAKIR